MPKFRKKPVVIEAWLIGPLLKSASNSWKELPKEVSDAYESGAFVFCSDRLYIKTLEGEMEGLSQDYLIRGVKSEFYPCKPDIFDLTYEAVAYLDSER